MIYIYTTKLTDWLPGLHLILVAVKLRRQLIGLANLIVEINYISNFEETVNRFSYIGSNN